MTEKEMVVSMIWNSLVQNTKSPFPVMEDEQEMLTGDIEYKLMRGWTPYEIIKYLSFTEYFNTTDSEDYCLKKMGEIEKKMLAKLGR